MHCRLCSLLTDQIVVQSECSYLIRIFSSNFEWFNGASWAEKWVDCWNIHPWSQMICCFICFFVCILKIKSKQKAIGTQSNNTCSSIHWLELDAKLWIFFDWGVFLMFAKHILGVFDAIGMPILGVFPWKVATLSNTKNRKIMDSTIIRYTKLFFLKDWLH